MFGKEGRVNSCAEVDCQPAALSLALVFVGGTIGYSVSNIISALHWLEVKVSDVGCGWCRRYYYIIDIVPLILLNQFPADINLNLDITPVYCTHYRGVVNDNIIGLTWCYGKGGRSLGGYQGPVAGVNAAFINLNFSGGCLCFGGG
ncbi:hypothetical protein ES703_109649 [subsurface metagenome]